MELQRLSQEEAPPLTFCSRAFIYKFVSQMYNDSHLQKNISPRGSVMRRGRCFAIYELSL